MNNKVLVLKFLVSLLLPIGLGGIAGLFTAQAVPEWYASLNRPAFSPPNWAFGPVWTVLYLLMGISLFLVWRLPPSQARNITLLVFACQLLLNFAWTFLFFYFHRIGWALVEIAVLWISIVVMLYFFQKVRPPAFWLNLPYLVWVTFAVLLTAAYYRLNT